MALIVLGIWSMTRVPLDAVPDITNNQVQVITQSPNLGTEDIEQFVTYPVELAMANLPGVTEIRSVSRFGLSLVTIVFEDNMGTYLPRQLVSEKLNEVKDDIPRGMGEPAMGPISTGLGEIYQYTLAVAPEYKDRYTLSDLRTIQDWIVRRQMAMVSGVVEVNAFGGEIKQYEVAVDPDQLKAIDLTITDILTALEKNNQNTGGAYIEKNHFANFIRGEGLARNLADIENTVVSNVNGLPIRIKDVAKVQYGKAVRYGAFTKDGEGEAVGGMILMLKGANSNDVIERVKGRIDEIQQSLPEGVHIEPFLERSKLIAQTTNTVSTNLMEGALIVIFVLVFLLGNWRGGLIVASTIPLSLLFAFIMMNIFGVWANLMSLGAIDFGIIVDGAVIIVEGTVFMLHEKLLKGKSMSAKLRNEVTKTASGKMMNSAFFGQLIILIVFIPILVLQGVEGKMFQPMALTFMFAMLGVMLLCLTYVPMMSAWFIRIGDNRKTSWGDRFIVWLQGIYDPLLARALKNAKWIMTSAVVMLGLSVYSFTQMGGEFIPQLDEGDIAFHIILKPGSSLTESVKASGKIEKLLLEKFPEIEHIMTRFGVADVPTDPMPMEVGDCFVLLKPKDQWTSASNKEELIELMKETVAVFPGINYEFTQPIEMRFNELITGVREDVAIKLFGEDLDILAEKAEEMGRIIATVDGVGDMKVEATKGLPQMTVNYNRHKLAQYGLHIDELNTVIQTAFAGGKAGVIFEGEKRFDLVVRLNEKHRQGINDLKGMYIKLPNGSQIPMKEVADISYEPGPMQISRDNTNRRTYVGINMRGRDVKSLVTEIQQKLNEQFELPPGYYIRYGGAFENLERASKRLQIVVPIALGLIFLLIYFALKSLKQSAMIYIAIPLAAIGGVFSLWLRDMPFSISAGIGFIVLFGVAVLNGLVLIGSWNELKEEGVSNLTERIKLGARRRIRPILLTALTDVLGFLPMAISTSAGAEVQQPLATVVIGGMISATLLTLFVLPILYQWVEGRNRVPKLSKVGISALLIFGFSLCLSPEARAQATTTTIVTVDEAIEIGLANNGYVQVGKAAIERQSLQKKAAFNSSKTNLSFQYGQYNSFQNDFSFNLNQNFEFPSVYNNRHKVATAKTEGEQLKLASTENNLRREIKSSWYQLAFLRQKRQLLLYQDSISQEFLRAATVRFEAEAGTYIEKIMAETKVMEIQNELSIIKSEIAIQQHQLMLLLHSPEHLVFKPESFEQKSIEGRHDSTALANNPMLAYAVQQIEIAGAERALASSKLMPDISVGYYNQSFIGNLTATGRVATGADRFTGIQIGLAFPLFYSSYNADIKSAQLTKQMAETNANYAQAVLLNQFEQQLLEVEKYQASLAYFETTAVPQAWLIVENAQKSFDNGAIGYIEYFQNLNQGLQLRLNYLNTLNAYNQAVINLEYLMGE